MNNTCTKDSNLKGHRPTSSLPSYSRSATDPHGGVSSSRPSNDSARARRVYNSALSKSALVSDKNSIDVSWFAQRGLMSKQSFKIYKKELKQQHRGRKKESVSRNSSLRRDSDSIDSDYTSASEDSGVGSNPVRGKGCEIGNRNNTGHGNTIDTPSGALAREYDSDQDVKKPKKLSELRKYVSVIHEESDRDGNYVPSTLQKIPVSKSADRRVSALGMQGCSFKKMLDEVCSDSDEDTVITTDAPGIGKSVDANLHSEIPNGISALAIPHRGTLERDVSALTLDGCGYSSTSDHHLDSSSRSGIIDSSAKRGMSIDSSDHDVFQKASALSTQKNSESQSLVMKNNNELLIPRTTKTSFKSSLKTIQSEDITSELFQSESDDESTSASDTRYVERAASNSPKRSDCDESNDSDNNDSNASSLAPVMMKRDKSTPRTSTLVCKNSAIDPSWFASRGLMSKNSYKQYKKETEAQNRDSFSTMTTSVSMKLAESTDVPIQIKCIGERLKRSNTDHDARVRKKRSPAANKSQLTPFSRSVSLDDGIQNITELFVAALRRSSESEKRTAFANLVLNVKEVEVLNGIAKRLSQNTQENNSDDEFFNEDEIEYPNMHIPSGQNPRSNEGVEQKDAAIDRPLSISLEDRISKDNLPVASIETRQTDRLSDLTCLKEGIEFSKEHDISQFEAGESILDISEDERKQLINIEIDEQSVSDEPTKNQQRESSFVPSSQVHSELSAYEEHVDVNSRPDSFPRSPRLQSIPSGDESEKSDSNKVNNTISVHLPTSAKNQDPHNDINLMDEGIAHLSIVMLALLYRKLREMSLLGHVSVKLRDIDVNSYQAISRQKEMKRRGLMTTEEESKGFLERTRTAGFIVRSVLDEYQMFKESTDLLSLNSIDQVTAEYDASILAEINTLVETQSGDPFGKDSLMKSLVDNEVEVVWFSDRHPNDLIYGICVSRQTRTVTVVFRGQESAFARIKDSEMTSYPNPIADEEYIGNKPTLRLRSAVSEELLRVRRDTSQTAVEFIRDKVQAIGNELSDGSPYHLTITGHGLAGGYATLLGFYLASDPTLDLASAVRVFTFASSRVGCGDFESAFRHLEDLGLILHARFTNQNDMVSLRPFFDIKGSWWFKDWYRHVGMRINLHGSTSSCRHAFDVEYNKESTFSIELAELLKSYILGRSKSSHVSDYFSRMAISQKALKAHGYKGMNGTNTLTIQEAYTVRDKFYCDEDSSNHMFIVIATLMSSCVVLNLAFLIKVVFSAV